MQRLKRGQSWQIKEERRKSRKENDDREAVSNGEQKGHKGGQACSITLPSYKEEPRTRCIYVLPKKGDLRSQRDACEATVNQSRPEQVVETRECLTRPGVARLARFMILDQLEAKGRNAGRALLRLKMEVLATG